MTGDGGTPTSHWCCSPPSLAIVLMALRDASYLLRPGALPAVVGVVAVDYFVNAMYLQRIQATAFVEVSSQLRDRVEGAVAASKAGERVLTARPSGFSERTNDRAHHGSTGRIDAAEAAGECPGTPGRRVGVFFVGVSRYTFGLFAPEIAVSVSFSEPLAPGESSRRTPPSLTIPTSRSTPVTASRYRSRVRRPRRRRGSNEDRRSRPRASWRVKPGIPMHYASTAGHARLVVGFDKGGDYLICKH